MRRLNSKREGLWEAWSSPRARLAAGPVRRLWDSLSGACPIHCPSKPTIAPDTPAYSARTAFSSVMVQRQKPS